jgi:hypothetical protein
MNKNKKKTKTRLRNANISARDHDRLDPGVSGLQWAGKLYVSLDPAVWDQRGEWNVPFSSQIVFKAEAHASASERISIIPPP